MSWYFIEVGFEGSGHSYKHKTNGGKSKGEGARDISQRNEKFMARRRRMCLCEIGVGLLCGNTALLCGDTGMRGS